MSAKPKPLLAPHYFFLAVLLACGHALAQVSHVYANGWQENDFQDASNPGCSIGGNGSVPGTRIILGASMRRPSPMELVIRRTAWAIPVGTPVHVRAVFPDGTVVPLNGTGHGQEVDVDMDDDSVPPWIHLLTASASMQLQFEGNEAATPWTFDLAGTSKVVGAMGDCFRQHAIQGLPQPFSRALGIQTASPVGPPPPPSPPAYSPASTPAPAAPPTGTQQDCRLIQSALERLQCYDRADAAAPRPAPAPVAAPSPPALATTAPSSPPAPASTAAEQPTDSTAANEKPPPPPATTGPVGPASASGGCHTNWRACQNNADLINNSDSAVIDARSACETATEHSARYGDPKLPGFWSGGAFNRFRTGDDYPRTGIVTLIEPDAQFQNAFSAMVHSTVVCRYDLNTSTVLGIDVEPNG